MPVVTRARRVPAGDQMDRFEHIGLPGTVASDERGDAGRELAFRPRVAPEVLEEEPGDRPAEHLDRIAVESRGQTRFVDVAGIDYITASGPYAELHVGERTYAVRERMQTLEERLDPAVFMRVHRSAIVRLDLVDALLRAPGGDYAVRLKDGTKLSVSRARRDELARRLR